MLDLEYLVEFSGRAQGGPESCLAWPRAVVLNTQGEVANGKSKFHLVISWQVPCLHAGL